MTRLANPCLTPCNPSAWTNLISCIEMESAREKVQELLTNSPINAEQIKDISEFLFFLQVPLDIVMDYFKARVDVHQNFENIINTVV